MPEIVLGTLNVQYVEGSEAPTVTLSSIAGRWDKEVMAPNTPYPILGADAVFYETAYHAAMTEMEDGLTVVRYVMAGQAHDLLCTDASIQESAVFYPVIFTEPIQRAFSPGHRHVEPPYWVMRDYASRQPTDPYM